MISVDVMRAMMTGFLVIVGLVLFLVFRMRSTWSDSDLVESKRQAARNAARALEAATMRKT
jgi:hypothetical protein